MHVRACELRRQSAEERDALAGIGAGEHGDARIRALQIDGEIARRDGGLIEVENVAIRIERDRLSVGQRAEVVRGHAYPRERSRASIPTRVRRVDALRVLVRLSRAASGVSRRARMTNPCRRNETSRSARYEPSILSKH